MTDIEVWHQFITFQKKYEAKYTEAFYYLIRRQAARVAKYLLKNGTELTEANMNTLIQKNETEAMLRQLYTEVGVRWANIEYANIEEYTKGWSEPVRLKRFGFNAIWEGLLNLFFSAYGGDKITSVDDTTKKWLIGKIKAGRDAGAGAEQIARSMVDDKEVPLMRARVISRTETVAAANYGGMTAARQSKLKMNKRWVNARDNRVRELHKDKSEGGVGGEVVPLEQAFSNGLMHPGDPKGGAKQVINCRCIASMRPVRSETGMPIAA